MDDSYCVKMRSAKGGAHISGAEKIVPSSELPRTVARLTERALKHSKGVPDFINVKVEKAHDVLELESLKVTTYETATEAEGRAEAAALLGSVGISRIDEIMALFPETYSMRGAMLLDADTLERLEPDRSRGVRATYMDDEESLLKGTASGKNHYAEAIVLATKVQNAPGIVGEICVSDDPDYVTGYVATRELGYCRITTIKKRGEPLGGRIFLYRGPHEKVSETLEFLERRAVIVRNVPMLGPVTAEWRFDLLEEESAAMEKSGLARRCRTLRSPTGPVAQVEVDGTLREITVLSSNDYLDLAREPSVTEAAAKAAREWGAGSGGSRLTTGTQVPHVELEKAIAEFKGMEDCVAYATGYMANTGVVSALVGKGDVVLSDELNHASIIDGCRLSGADIVVYRHNDMEDLERKLSSCREHRRRLVVSDGVFSMDGDILDLPAFVSVCGRYDAFSMVDEAHATGVVGATGRGLAELYGCDKPDIVVGTMSKALGSEGGFVCASKAITDFLRNRSRSFIFSTAPGAPSVAAALAALRFLDAHPGRIEELRAKIRIFTNALRANGIDVVTDTPIVPIMVGDERVATAVAEECLKKGFLVPAIRYPTVPKGSARLRAVVMSSHSAETLVAAAAAIAAAMGRSGKV